MTRMTGPEDIGTILSDHDRRIYRIEQSVSSASVLGSSVPEYYDEIKIGEPGNFEVISLPVTAPTGIIVTTGSVLNSSYADVSWTPPADGTAESYQVALFEKQADGSFLFADSQREFDTRARFNNLRPGQVYGVRVWSVNRAGRSAVAPVAGYVEFTAAADATIPGQVAGLLAYGGLRSVVLVWDENADEDVRGNEGWYDVQIDSVNTFDSQAGQPLHSVRITATVVSFSDLSPQVTYYARIRAVDSSGNEGPWSLVVAVTTQQAGEKDIGTGVIIGDHIVGGAVTTDKLHAGSVVADKIAADAITSVKIKAGAVTADKLSSLTISVSKWIAASNYNGGGAGVPGTTGWYIGGDGYAEFNDVRIRGSLIGVTGTFAGSLSAASGTFKGSLSAATGTFAGELSAASGSFTGALSSGTVDSSVITGGTIRTAATGERIQMRSSWKDRIEAHNADGTYVYMRGGTSGGMEISGSLKLLLGTSNGILYARAINVGANYEYVAYHAGNHNHSTGDATTKSQSVNTTSGENPGTSGNGSWSTTGSTVGNTAYGAAAGEATPGHRHGLLAHTHTTASHSHTYDHTHTITI